MMIFHNAKHTKTYWWFVWINVWRFSTVHMHYYYGNL